MRVLSGSMNTYERDSAKSELLPRQRDRPIGPTTLKEGAETMIIEDETNSLLAEFLHEWEHGLELDMSLADAIALMDFSDIEWFDLTEEHAPVEERQWLMDSIDPIDLDGTPADLLLEVPDDDADDDIFDFFTDSELLELDAASYGMSLAENENLDHLVAEYMSRIDALFERVEKRIAAKEVQ